MTCFVTMVHEVVPCVESFAPRYAAAHCRRCDSSGGLTLVDGEFECRDRDLCAMWVDARERAQRRATQGA